MTTLHDMLTEMQSYIEIDTFFIDKAKESDTTTQNNVPLRMLVRDWADGVYDEDPDILVNELILLLD